MFRNIRRLWNAWKKNLFNSYEQTRPTIYKIGKKKYIRVKRIRVQSKSKGPYIK